MSIGWTTPNNIIQYEEDPSHIRWNSDESNVITLARGGVSLSAPLLHISRQPRNDIIMKSWFIRATNFNFQNLPETISGIQFRFTVDRVGRVSDDTIQLTVNDELIGDNMCVRTVDPIQVYGGETHMWGVNNLSEIVQDPTFGIVVRLKAHPNWPHKTTPILRALELQIY